MTIKLLIIFFSVVSSSLQINKHLSTLNPNDISYQLKTSDESTSCIGEEDKKSENKSVVTSKPKKLIYIYEEGFEDGHFESLGKNYVFVPIKYQMFGLLFEDLMDYAHGTSIGIRNATVEMIEILEKELQDSEIKDNPYLKEDLQLNIDNKSKLPLLNLFKQFLTDIDEWKGEIRRRIEYLKKNEKFGGVFDWLKGDMLDFGRKIKFFIEEIYAKNYDSKHEKITPFCLLLLEYFDYFIHEYKIEWMNDLIKY